MKWWENDYVSSGNGRGVLYDVAQPIAHHGVSGNFMSSPTMAMRISPLMPRQISAISLFLYRCYPAGRHRLMTKRCGG